MLSQPIDNDDYQQGLNYEEKKDFEKAAESYRLSANKGNRDGQNKLGLLYLSGLWGVEKNVEEALRLFHLSAGQGNVSAQNNLGHMHFQGNGVEKDEKEAARLFHLSSEQGDDAGAQYHLGLQYENGRGVEQNVKEAVRFYLLAAGKGHAGAQFQLAGLYLTDEVKADPQETVRLYRSSANKGYAAAQFSLGYLYNTGFAVEKDSKEAARLYKLAADKGNVNAQHYLGCLYEHGDGVEKDVKEAARLYQLSANQGNAASQNNLAVLYTYGLGVDKDLNEAIRLFRLSADQGNADAQNNLGYLYLNGHGVNKDLKEALRFFHLAANQEKTPAQQNLALLSLLGYAVNNNNNDKKVTLNNQKIIEKLEEKSKELKKETTPKKDPLKAQEKRLKLEEYDKIIQSYLRYPSTFKKIPTEYLSSAEAGTLQEKRKIFEETHNAWAVNALKLLQKVNTEKDEKDSTPLALFNKKYKQLIKKEKGSPSQELIETLLEITKKSESLKGALSELDQAQKEYNNHIEQDKKESEKQEVLSQEWKQLNEVFNKEYRNYLVKIKTLEQLLRALNKISREEHNLSPELQKLYDIENKDHPYHLHQEISKIKNPTIENIKIMNQYYKDLQERGRSIDTYLSSNQQKLEKLKLKLMKNSSKKEEKNKPPSQPKLKPKVQRQHDRKTERKIEKKIEAIEHQIKNLIERDNKQAIVENPNVDNNTFIEEKKNNPVPDDNFKRKAKDKKAIKHIWYLMELFEEFQNNNDNRRLNELNPEESIAVIAFLKVLLQEFALRAPLGEPSIKNNFRNNAYYLDHILADSKNPIPDLVEALQQYSGIIYGSSQGPTSRILQNLLNINSQISREPVLQPIMKIAHFLKSGEFATPLSVMQSSKLLSNEAKRFTKKYLNRNALTHAVKSGKFGPDKRDRFFKIPRRIVNKVNASRHPPGLNLLSSSTSSSSSASSSSLSSHLSKAKK